MYKDLSELDQTSVDLDLGINIIITNKRGNPV
jgi:hypothetical protein